MAVSGVSFWRRVTIAAMVAIVLIVVIPALIPKYLRSGDRAHRGLKDKFRDYTDKFSHGHGPDHHDHHGPHDPHQHPYLHPTDHQCQDPYLEPGYLTTNWSEISKNFWTPFNSECPPAPHFLQDVIDRKPLPWLQGRTLLMVGDSVDRNNLRFFCELVGSDKMRVTSMTNLSEVTLGDTDLEPWNIDPGDLTRPRICRVEEYDFEIVMFFHYGMQDEEIWTEKNVYTPPGLIEKRIPMLKPLFEDYGRKPDMIILASGLWDLAGWVKDDAYAFAPVRTSVEPERLEHWIDRAEQFVDIVSGIFPGTFMVWRTLHYCVVDWGWWFLKEAPDWVDRTPRAPFHELRIYQMNHAYNRLLERRPHLHKFTWGELLTGHLDEAMDYIHPGKDVGGVIWSDMMLYYMSRLRTRPGEH